MPDILDRIYAAKQRSSAQSQAEESYESVREKGLLSRASRRPFLEAIRRANGPAIIAEMKRASPSAGLIARNFDPAAIAREYERAGVDAISVLTESDHFLGELAYLAIARQETSRPLLRKDFLRTPYEIAQSAAYGADAVLLIVGGLTDAELRECLAEAKIYALDVLVEVHDVMQIRRALDAGAEFVGVNNRNLRTFETDLAVSEELLPALPGNVVAISESGMRAPEDILRLHRAGARGFLIGESLMRSDDPAGLVASLKAAVVVLSSEPSLSS